VKGLRHRSKLHPQVIRLERELHSEEFSKFLCTSYTIGSKLVMHLWCYNAEMAKSRLLSQLQARTRGKDRSEGLPFNKTSLKGYEIICNKGIYCIVLLRIFNTLLKASVLISYPVSRS
jgi:hypothetical protein